MEVNFEELRAATEAIYSEKPDLDWALIIYDYFEGTTTEVEQAFSDFRDKHQDEVISDISAIDFGAWTLLGDFKANREKMTFYNKHTNVIERILERHAEDKKLGGDLMRNRVRQLKAKNIREAGPDAPGLAEYRAQGATTGGSLSSMGAECVISHEEMDRLERARGNIHTAKDLEVLDQCQRTIRDLSAAAKVRDLSSSEASLLKNAKTDLIRAQEMLEVPDNAIQVDVFTHDTKSGKIGKSKFYTKSEVPDNTTKIGMSKDVKTTLAPFAQEQLAHELLTKK